MAKISMVIPDDALAEIDGQAAGNRTAFMVGAARDRARELRRIQMDAEIARACGENAEADLRVYRDWESTLVDGLA